MSDTVRVRISYDHETCTYSFNRVAQDHDGPYVFDIEAQWLKRWEWRHHEWQEIVGEMERLYLARHNRISREQETARLKAKADEAIAAYEAHLAKTTPKTSP